MSGRHHWLFLIAGSLSLAAGQWLTLWLLARTAPPETVGLYGLAVAWAAPLCALSALQLRSLMATETHLEARFPVYLRLRALAIAGLIIALLPLFLVNLPGFGTGALLAAVAAWRVVELGSDFTDGLRHRERSYFALGVSQSCRSVAAFAIFAISFLSGQSLVASLLAAACSALGCALMVDLPVLRRHWIATRTSASPSDGSVPIPDPSIPAKANSMHGILIFAVPLAMVQFLNLGVIALPRLLLGAFSSLDEVASFTCLVSLLSVSSLLASAYTASLAPEFADALHSQHQAATSLNLAAARSLLLRAGRRVGLGSLPLVLLLAVAGAPLLRAIYGQGIAFPRWSIGFMALFAALWSLAAVFGTAATAGRRIGIQLAAFGLALASAGVAGLIWIPVHGVDGATASLLVAATVLLSSYLFYFRRFWLPGPWAMASLPDEAKPQTTWGSA
ncbi:MAG: hypothetical protein U5J83_08675 [Bryobacterales bacterium]|nr:hypothetical protein [Bryobacterales bacterium]